MKKTTKIVLKAATKIAVKTAKSAAVRHAAKATREMARDLVLNNTKKESKNQRYDESVPIEAQASIVDEEFAEETAVGDAAREGTARDEAAVSAEAVSEVEVEVVLRSMTETDRAAVIELMRSFYVSDAVLTNGSEEIFNNDIDACVSDNPYLEGYVFTAPVASYTEAIGQSTVTDNEDSANAPDAEPEGSPIALDTDPEVTGSQASEIIAGYAMIAHSFSTEYGKPCIWIEDIYLREEARGLGLASKFFEFLKSEYPDALHRLESERSNLRAMGLYKREDFSEMPYVELFRDPE